MLYSLIQNDIRSKITYTQEQAWRFYNKDQLGYAGHDEFLGVRTPDVRAIAKKWAPHVNFDDIQRLLKSPYNEERLLALFILIDQYQSTNDKKLFIDFYLDHRACVNNWNLVDASAHFLLGDYLVRYQQEEKPEILYTYAHSTYMWERRIAIVSSWAFIKNNILGVTYELALILLNDPHDLIHKATGWMLREASKKDPHPLLEFIASHERLMPRTQYRYAVEHVKKLGWL